MASKILNARTEINWVQDLPRQSLFPTICQKEKIVESLVSLGAGNAFEGLPQCPHP